MPFKAFASVPLGTPPPDIPGGATVPIGLMFHVTFSIVLGIIYALIVVRVLILRTSPTALVIAGSVYGIVIWVLDLYVVAPALGRPWFARQPPAPTFIYHTFFSGIVLGLYLVRALREPGEVGWGRCPDSTLGSRGT